MSKERETVILKTLEAYKEGETARLIKELITLRRERYRDRLEKDPTEVFSGRALECKDLLQIFD